MKNTLALCLTVLLLLAGRTAARAGDQDFTLVNKTGLEITELYVSPSKSDDWEEDVLGQDVLADGAKVDITFKRNEKAAKWDIKIKDSDGDEIVWTGFNLLEISKITLKYENKKPTATFE